MTARPLIAESPTCAVCDTDRRRLVRFMLYLKHYEDGEGRFSPALAQWACRAPAGGGVSFRYPALQQQFKPRDNTSKYDCTATAGGILGDADSKGKLVFNHAQVRARTDEPIPNIGTPQHPGSPGLNWQQVDASLYRLSGGRINLDVHPGGSPWADLLAALRAGKWGGVAVWRQVLIDAGYGGGNPFAGAHAVVYVYDQVRKVFVMGDPLVNRWIDVPTSVMSRAARAFLVHSGYGSGASGAYYTLTRDVYDAPTSSLQQSAVFTPGALWVYSVSGGQITGREVRRFTKATSAPCDPRDEYDWPGHGTRLLVRVQKGALADRYVEPGTSHVSLVVTK